MNEPSRKLNALDCLKNFFRENSTGLLVAAGIATSVAAWNGAKYVDFRNDDINIFSYNYRYKARAQNSENLSRLIGATLVEAQENWPWYLGMIAVGPFVQAGTRKIRNLRRY